MRLHGVQTLAREVTISDSRADAALEQLYDEHYLRLIRLATLLLGDPGGAEELVQDAFVEVHRRHDRIDRSKVPAYLRQRVVRSARPSRRQVRGGPPVIHALAALPRRHREVLVLRHYLDLSVAEIAETLQIGHRAVTSHATHGAAALRSTLGVSQMDELRDLVASAVADVHEVHGPEDVRRRVGRRRGVARAATAWVPLTVVTAALVALVLVGSSWLAHGGGSGPSVPRVRTISDVRYVDVPLYFVGGTGQGVRLFREQRIAHVRPGGVVQAALDLAVSATAKDPDYDNPLSHLGLEVEARLSPDRLEVDFSRRPTLSGREARLGPLLVQALVRTAQSAAESQQPVSFLVGGHRVDTMLGVDTRDPVEPTGDDSTLSPVQIDSPGQGSTVRTTFTVRGVVASTRADVAWELRRGRTVLKHGSATAQQCCTLSPYSFDVTVPPGRYRLVVHDVDATETVDSKEIRVSQGRF